MGAFDGKTYSNSLMLECVLNSKPAFLIEPSPPSVFRIRANRPKSQVLQLAVGIDFSIAEFYGDKAVSGLAENLTDLYIKRWGVDKFQKFKVITAPFKSIQEVMGFNFIDFLSIDIQGGELDLFLTMDWSIPIGVICVELEGHHPAKDEMCRQLMRNNGFIFSGKLLISEIWFNPLSERRKLIYDPDRRLNLDMYEFSEYSLKHLNIILPALSEAAPQI